jgi:UDP-N-acetylmuramyl pentapeptide phosphotransferase/UDP-N-acetylglucosamine-1-phosphate transferase
MSFFLYLVNMIVIFFLFMNSSFVGKKLDLIDRPDGVRKTHRIPTPAVGGLFFFIFIFFYLLIYFNNI